MSFKSFCMKCQKFVMIALSFSLSAISTIAQTVNEIKSNSIELKAKGINEGSRFYFGTEQDQKQKNELISILNLDVIQYYNLRDTYNSDLKMKLFKESEDYKNKLNELTTLKANALSKTYYLDFDPNFKFRNDQLKYDLKTKTCYINTEIKGENKNQTLMPQFDQLTIKYKPGTGISATFRDYTARTGSKYSEERIYFKVPSEQLALKIEENALNIRIIFVVKLLNTTEFSYRDTFFNMLFTEYLINASLINVIIYDQTNNETIIEYK